MEREKERVRDGEREREREGGKESFTSYIAVVDVLFLDCLFTSPECPSP